MSLDKERTFPVVNIENSSTGQVCVESVITVTDRDILKATRDEMDEYHNDLVIAAIGRALLRSDSEDPKELLLGLCDLALSVEDE